MTHGNLYAQTDTEEWDWQWGKSAEVYTAYTGTANLGIFTDFENNFYNYYWYTDSIIICDTAFRHLGSSPYQYSFNLALVKYDQNGEFIRAVDFYNTLNNSVFEIDIKIDHDSNIYVYGTYTDTLFVNNNFITNSENGFQPSIFLIKLTNDFEFIWGKTISSPAQDLCGGIDISNDNSIYLSSNHVYYPDSVVRVVNYLNQDSAKIDKGLNSILKIDSDGNLLWRKEIRSCTNGYAESYVNVVGEDDYIYSIVNANSNFIINNDTVILPNSDGAKYITKYDSMGELRNAFFIDLENFGITYTSGVEVDKLGNFYAAGIISKSTIFGNDTIIIPDNTKGLLIAKFDSLFQPKWSKYVDDYSKISIYFLIDLFGDKLSVAMTGKRQFSFAGIDFSFGWYWNGILTQFDTAGNLISHQIVESTNSLQIKRMCIDNCGNYLLSGYLYDGEAYFGDDTITTKLPREYILAKNYCNYPPLIYLPSDTSGCKELTLNAPDGYLYYKWNDELINQDWFQVFNTGIVNLKVSNGAGCWSETESNVTIFTEIELSLGNDTTIYLTDTLEISINDSYESYLWSTGDTVSDLTIPASDLELGNNQIWLEVDNGPCSASDSINVIVIDNSGVEELFNYTIHIYPNPANKRLNIINKNNLIIENVFIYNLSGQKLISTKPINNSIDIVNLQTGIYIIELVTNHLKIRRKLVIK